MRHNARIKFFRAGSRRSNASATIGSGSANQQIRSGFLSAHLGVIIAQTESSQPPSTERQVSTATTEPEITDRIRKEVAGLVKKNEADLDIAKPLVDQGTDELDIVEIVMATEDAFAVEIPDDALANKFANAAKTLTIQKLAAIVAEKKESK